MKLFRLYLFDQPCEYIAAENAREAVMKALYKLARSDSRLTRETNLLLPLVFANCVTAREIKEAPGY